MSPVKSSFKLSRSEEAVLRQKLSKTLLTITSIVVFLFVTIFFFAPKLGAFFGFFSVHRNETDTTGIIKPNPPAFSNVPTASKEDSIILNGYSQAGLTIILYVNGPEAQRTTAGSDGQFTFNNVVLNAGANTIFAKASSQSNVLSDNSVVYTVTQDKEKPKIKIDSPKDGDTITNLDKRVTITGSVNKKSAVKINGSMVIVKPDLSFSYLLGVSEGEVKIVIEATDEAGNVQSQKLTVTYVKG